MLRLSILSISKCVCIYFQNYFLFSDCLARSFFQTNIDEENTFLFEQNANIGINVCECVSVAVCFRQRAKWYSWRQSPKGNELSGFPLRFWLEIEIFGFVWCIVVVVFVLVVTAVVVGLRPFSAPLSFSFSFFHWRVFVLLYRRYGCRWIYWIRVHSAQQ